MKTHSTVSASYFIAGKITDKAISIQGGYDVGEITIAAFDGQSPDLTISVKNEYLLATLNTPEGAKVLASVPDLIVLVDYETSEPINAERIKYGQRVGVFAVGCPDCFRTEDALKVVSPKCFGFDVDYVPLEELV